MRRLLASCLLLSTGCADLSRPDGRDASAGARLPRGFSLLTGGIVPPEVPALAADTHLMDPDESGAMQFNAPLYPALRTTADGRLGVNIRARDGLFELYLLGPEGLTEPLGRSGPGVHMSLDSVTIDPEDLFVRVADEGENHVLICDPTSQFPAPGDATQPRPCDADPTQDCYEFTLVTDVQARCNIDGCDGPGESFDTRLWGTLATVAVADPKTDHATIASVTLGAPVSGPLMEVRGFFEPSIAGDGRLLVARLDWTRILVPTVEDPSVSSLRAMNMAYLLPDDPAAFAPCDVRQWTHVDPISHLPHDLRATAYGLAQAPFRDGEGAVIPDWETVGLSYPWLDRGGDNLFFTSVRSTLYYDADPDEAVDDIRTRYPTKCLDGVPCARPTTAAEIEDVEDTFITRGIGVMGSWTRGKMVVLDGSLNHTDFGLRREPSQHRQLGLYLPRTGPDPSATGLVHVGTGRDNGGTSPLGTTQNTAFVDSFEQRFFYADAMVPTTVREVVWTINTGHGSVEVPFDDYLDVGAFVIADMTASIVQTGLSARDSLGYNDGFVAEPAVGLAGFHLPVRFQNASTVLDTEWQVPAAGVAFGNVRVEPVALGGVHGKGLWLSGRSAGVVFEVPAQTTYEVAGSDWYTGLFLDSRSEDDGVTRALLTWPDGSGLAVRGRAAVVLEDPLGVEVATVTLPDGGLPFAAWRHVAFNLTAGGTSLEVLVDGFPAGQVTLPEPMLLPVEGSLVLGDRSGDGRSGFRGWVDELKIFTYAQSPELACNHARGTLVELGPTADEQWQLVADGRPADAHDAIAAALGRDPGPRFACVHDYSVATTVAANTAPLPDDTTPIRHDLLRPGVELVAGLPRPDESATPFCSSCHREGQPEGLSLAALAFDRSLALEDDPRRQPMAPPRLLFGNIPADHVGPGLPASAVVAPPEGYPLDPVTFPP